MTTTAETASATFLNERDWSGRIYSGGWIDAPDTIESIEPATGQVLGVAGVGDADAINRAAAAAAAAQPAWAATPISDRIAVIRRAADLMEQHRPELERWLIRESGSIQGKAAQEVSASIGQLVMATALIAQPTGYDLPSLTPGRSSTARRAPVGVVGVITPWNFPYVLALRSVGPALALGNAIVLKPDLNTPISGGAVIARIFEDAGLPEGLLHVIPGGADVGQAMCESPLIRMISFTGSTATGRLVGATAGRTLKRIVLELGGNSPLVVLDDADIEAASSAGAWGSFLHQGQICLAVSRHLVHESIADAYLEALTTRASHLPVGDPNTEEVALGPIINEKQVTRVQRIVDETIAAGARATIGGSHEGLFYKPTVLAGVTPEMAAFREEIFGPVAPVITFSSDEEAIVLANQTEYGLAAAVQSGSPQRAAAVADRLHAGMVHINDQTVNEEPPAPFGGFGSSSNGGHFGGVANIELWTEWQWVTARNAASPFPF
jgi:benzaldehyde dehydrogenase (NAD)